MTESHDHETEARIRAALNARADTTIVSADAIDKIHASRPSSPWARPMVYAAVAGVVTVIIGAALFFSPNETADPINTAEDPPTTGAPETTTPPETTEPPTPSDLPTVPADFDPRAVNAEGISDENLQSHPFHVIAAGLAIPGAYINTGQSAEATAEGFVMVSLGLDRPTLQERTLPIPVSAFKDFDGTVQAFDVMQMTESGEVSSRAAFTVVLAELDGNPWVVTHVFTDSFRVHTVETNTTETLRITGAGSAFEGTGILNIGLDDTVIAVGSGGFDDFSVVVPRRVEDAPVQVTLLAPSIVEGQFPNIATYMTWPIDTSTTLSVFGVAVDDVLNVRSGAGTGNGIVATLAADASGILHTGDVEFIDGERWWEIDADGARGWVNSRFLVVNRDLTRTAGLDDRMRESILMPLSGLDPATLASPVDIGGIGVYADWPTPWTTIGRDDFDVRRNWSPEGTEDRSCDCDMGVEQFLGFDTARWNLAEYRVPGDGPSSDNWGWSHGLSPEFFDRYTTGSIYIPEPNPDEALDWRRYTIVFDFEDGTPVVRGIWRWGWTP